MNDFIKWLEKLNERDGRARAVLRRSLSFDPGTYVPAFPYVEPFAKDEKNPWRRTALYLVAGLWAMHWRQDCPGPFAKVGRAAATQQAKTGSTNTERRFIALLDADSDQLPHRLRQMVSLLKEESLDFGDMLNGLLYWNDDQKRTQNAWARDFYRNLNNATETDNQTDKEVSA